MIQDKDLQETTEGKKKKRGTYRYLSVLTFSCIDLQSNLQELDLLFRIQDVMYTGGGC